MDMDASKVFVPELQRSVAAFVARLSDYTQKGVELASREIPAIIKEYLQLIFIEHAVWLSIQLFFVVCVVVACVTAFKVSNCLNNDDKGVFRFFIIIVASVLLAIGFGYMANHLIACIQIWLSPRAFLIKHVIEMVK